MYNLLMDKKSKLIFKHNSFDIIEQGDYVLCAISGKKILRDLNYWNVIYKKLTFTLEVKERLNNLKKFNYFHLL